MKTSKLIIAAALTALIAGTSPALAQTYNNGQHGAYANGPYGNMATQRNDGNYSRDLNARVSDLRVRLDRGLERRQLTRSEFKRLNSDLNKLSVEIRNASRGIRAIDRRDFERFDDRLDRFEARISFERHDNNRGPQRR